MNELIKELKAEHQQLTMILQKVKKLGIITSETKMLLSESKQSLLDHIKKEDDLLYPVMYQQAEHDPKLAVILKIFGQDLEKLAAQVLAFYEKYEQESKETDFSKDFTQFFATLSNRIGKEESILFKEYEQIVESDKNEAGV